MLPGAGDLVDVEIDDAIGTVRWSRAPSTPVDSEPLADFVAAVNTTESVLFVRNRTGSVSFPEVPKRPPKVHRFTSWNATSSVSFLHT